MDGTLVKITQREVDVQRDLVLARSDLYLIKDSLVKAVESCRGGVLDADAARKLSKELEKQASHLSNVSSELLVCDQRLGEVLTLDFTTETDKKELLIAEGNDEEGKNDESMDSHSKEDDDEDENNEKVTVTVAVTVTMTHIKP
jgi:hypothetical protein